MVNPGMTAALNQLSLKRLGTFALDAHFVRLKTWVLFVFLPNLPRTVRPLALSAVTAIGRAERLPSHESSKPPLE